MPIPAQADMRGIAGDAYTKHFQLRRGLINQPFLPGTILTFEAGVPDEETGAFTEPVISVTSANATPHGRLTFDAGLGAWDVLIFQSATVLGDWPFRWRCAPGGDVEQTYTLWKGVFRLELP